MAPMKEETWLNKGTYWRSKALKQSKIYEAVKMFEECINQ